MSWKHCKRGVSCSCDAESKLLLIEHSPVKLALIKNVCLCHIITQIYIFVPPVVGKMLVQNAFWSSVLMFSLEKFNTIRDMPRISKMSLGHYTTLKCSLGQQCVSFNPTNKYVLTL